MLWHSGRFPLSFCSSTISTATFFGHARMLQSPPLMLWSIYTLQFLSVIQEAELTQIWLQNGEYTTFKLRTIMLQPHPLGSNRFSSVACSERTRQRFLQRHWFSIGAVSSSTYWHFIEEATTRKTPHRRLSGTLTDWKTSSQHKPDHKL